MHAKNLTKKSVHSFRMNVSMKRMPVSPYYNGKIVIYIITNHYAHNINVIGIKIMNVIRLVDVMIIILNFVQ